MKIKIGLKVKDNKYPEEKVYRISGIDNDSAIPTVILKTEKPARFESRKIWTPKKTFWDRFSLIS